MKSIIIGTAGHIDHGKTALVKAPVGTSPVRGANDAWVTMIEFGDFECPYCGAEEPVVQALLQEWAAEVALGYRGGSKKLIKHFRPPKFGMK